MIQRILLEWAWHCRVIAVVVTTFVRVAYAQDARPHPLSALRAAAVSPARPPATLKLIAKLGPGSGQEISGIVKSRNHNDCFWSINDSGNAPRVYALHRNGAEYRSPSDRDAAGILVEGSQNVDWEDIAIDADGRLIIADVGNNANERRDLALYYIDEPSPTADRAPVVRKISVCYPDQPEFPPPKNNFNFDCEAVFAIGNMVHFLTKHRSDRLTTLYRLDDPRADRINVLTRVDAFDVGGMVTAADASADGKRMVAITYQGVWLFERADLTKSFFDGRIAWAPFLSVQMESVCFADGETLLLADEKLATLYELPMAALTVVQSGEVP